jgi:hypothetical protein
MRRKAIGASFQASQLHYLFFAIELAFLVALEARAAFCQAIIR